MIQKRAGAPTGNTNGSKPDGTHYISKRFRLRPDQVERLELECNQSEAVRRAIDMYLSIHPADTDDIDYAAALDAMAADDSE